MGRSEEDGGRGWSPKLERDRCELTHALKGRGEEKNGDYETFSWGHRLTVRSSASVPNKVRVTRRIYHSLKRQVFLLSFFGSSIQYYGNQYNY